jgi:hypothetical protein
MATYGRPPSDFDQETAMGLMANIPMVEARRALSFAQGIAVAFGSPEAAEGVVRQATGSDELAWSVRMGLQHQMHGRGR